MNVSALLCSVQPIFPDHCEVLKDSAWLAISNLSIQSLVACNWQGPALGPVTIDTVLQRAQGFDSKSYYRKRGQPLR